VSPGEGVLRHRLVIAGPDTTIGAVSPEPPEPADAGAVVDPDLGPDDARPTLAQTCRTALVVAGGGGLGGLARLGLNTAAPRPAGGFGWATFTENVLGSLLIGVLMVLVLDVWGADRSQHYLRPFLGTGVLGGFTTFSAYTSDTRSLLAAGHPGSALLYLFGTLAAGLVAAIAGLAVARALVGSARPASSQTSTQPGGRS
jgi:fluoride exporter